jgi:hypothetical protein
VKRSGDITILEKESALQRRSDLCIPRNETVAVCPRKRPKWRRRIEK